MRGGRGGRDARERSDESQRCPGECKIDGPDSLPGSAAILQTIESREEVLRLGNGQGGNQREDKKKWLHTNSVCGRSGLSGTPPSYTSDLRNQAFSIVFSIEISCFAFTATAFSIVTWGARQPSTALELPCELDPIPNEKRGGRGLPHSTRNRPLPELAELLGNNDLDQTRLKPYTMGTLVESLGQHQSRHL